MEALARATRLARRQKGLITHRQALEAGLASSTIAEYVARGQWMTRRPGVYVVGGAPPSWEQELLAVTLPFDDCWIDFATAARLWSMRHAPDIDAIEVLRPYGRYRRLEGVVAHRSRIIVPEDVTKHRGIPVTSRARTIVDCSSRLTVAQTGKLIDDAMRVDKRSLEEVRECFVRLSTGGRRRRRSIRGALAFRIPGYDPGESDLELTTLRTIIAAGLRIPVQQYRIVLNGKRCRIDLAYPAWKIAIELQSWNWHGGREPFDDDKARMSDLTDRMANTRDHVSPQPRGHRPLDHRRHRAQHGGVTTPCARSCRYTGTSAHNGDRRTVGAWSTRRSRMT